jgi:hypothetical protein
MVNPVNLKKDLITSEKIRLYTSKYVLIKIDSFLDAERSMI